ncbi:FadR/GntR family transcriptional regulator [Rhodococcus sp. NPDC055024]
MERRNQPTADVPGLGHIAREVTTVSVPQGVAEHLKGMIRRGELGPGDQLLPARQLAQELGVAYMSLHEALKRLREDGYITVRRGKSGGTFVSSLRQPVEEWRKTLLGQEGELDDVTTLRVAVECHAAALAAVNRTDDDLAAMQTAIHQEAEAENRAEFRLADARFHHAVAKAANSPRLAQAIQAARGELFSPTDMLDHPEPREEDLEQHEDIYQAIRDANPDLASTAMRIHIEFTRDELHRILGHKSAHLH